MATDWRLSNREVLRTSKAPPNQTRVPGAGEGVTWNINVLDAHVTPWAKVASPRPQGTKSMGGFQGISHISKCTLILQI